MGVVGLSFIQVERQSRLPRTLHAGAFPDSFKTSNNHLVFSGILCGLHCCGKAYHSLVRKHVNATLGNSLRYLLIINDKL